jgi:hypothetical protein
MSQTVFNQSRQESLLRIQAVVDGLRDELEDGLERFYNCAGEHSFSAPALFRIAATLELVSFGLKNESDWFGLKSK